MTVPKHYLQKFQPGLVSEWRPPAFLDRRPTPERAARTSSLALAPTSRAHASMALFMSPFASLGAARPRPRSSAAFGCGRARPSPSRGPVVHRRRSADDASRGALTIARGKKKKGFAELMGGDDADDAVAVKKKGAASESDRCPCGGGAENLPVQQVLQTLPQGGGVSPGLRDADAFALHRVRQGRGRVRGQDDPPGEPDL